MIKFVYQINQKEPAMQFGNVKNLLKEIFFNGITDDLIIKKNCSKK